ncbi:MAG: HAD family phosphatase [Candidatus Aenigmatarchaeota archaeon]
MITTILFDVGGVIVEEEFKDFFGQYEKETGFSKQKLYEAIVDIDFWDMYNKGKATEDQLEEKIREKTNIDPKILHKIRTEWRHIIKPYPHMIELVEKIKKNYKVFCLSNVDKDTVKYINKNYPDVYKVFPGCVLSCDVGMIKPDKEIFDYTLRKFGLKKEEVIFIDNYSHNTEAAESFGIKSIKFESHDQLVKELKMLGIQF